MQVFWASVDGMSKLKTEEMVPQAVPLRPLVEG